MIIFIKKYTPQLILLVLITIVVGKSMYPGYILLLDMGWAPTVPLVWSSDSLNNVFPVYAILHFLTLIVPSWIVQKLLLILMVSALFFIPWKYLPFITNSYGRIFAVCIFALNPFVYSRVISGQWLHLLGYAFLPFLIYSLIHFTDNVNKYNSKRVLLALLAISFFSIHFLYLALILCILWVSIFILRLIYIKSYKQITQILIYFGIVSSYFLFFSLYWLLPALMRASPLEKRFDENFFLAFAAAPNDTIPVMLNVLALGGFWGEGLAWKYYYLWPQNTLIFWIASSMLWVLILIGSYVLYKKNKFASLWLVMISILAFIAALGASETPFKESNLFLYEHIPFWSGLRDSHKIVGLLALGYSIFSGVAVSLLLDVIKKRNTFIKLLVRIIIFSIPIFFGIYMWGGFFGQLKPVNYPSDWYLVKEEIDNLPKDEKILVLPWHRYLSLPFVDNRLVANPAEAFFGKDRIIFSRGVDFDSIHDQEVDVDYRRLDTFIKNASYLSREEVTFELQARKIIHVLIITNPKIPKSEEGLTYWTQFSGGNPGEEQKTWKELFPGSLGSDFEGSSIILRRILK